MSDYRGFEEIGRDKVEKPDPVNERVVYFLYLLMRDELPTGTVCKMITDMDENNSFQFTNSHLEALARDYAGRIRTG